MSGGSGLRRFVGGASTSASESTGAPGQGPRTVGSEATGAAGQAPRTAAGSTATAEPESARAQADTADARATLEAALGRPLEPADQTTASTGPSTSIGPSTGIGPGAATQEIEKCELCSTVIPAEHGHLADLDSSSLMCACRACYLLFTRPDAIRGRYRAIPDRYLTDPEHPISTAEWDALEIPVGLAFFLRDSRTGHVTGFYPSPAGATECRLDLQAWNDLATDHPLLNAAEPDVEAILISRPDPRAEAASSRSVETFVVPIDACYELAGRMRLYWRGFDGGSEAKSSIADFLGEVRTRARSLGQGA